ncbi:MAG: DUF4162 domain-containing protein, partial [Erysipelotrichaceae bacterium]|nr:DUF4162 domain-containing protein [Erysipelotrichaceae bacterium]
EAAVADYVIVIDNGKIVAKGTPIELKDRYSQDRLLIDAKDKESLIKILNDNKIDHEFEDVIKIMLNSTMDAIDIVNLCRDHIRGFEVIRGTMDDAFIAITGKGLRE